MRRRKTSPTRRRKTSPVRKRKTSPTRRRKTSPARRRKRMNMDRYYDAASNYAGAAASYFHSFLDNDSQSGRVPSDPDITYDDRFDLEAFGSLISGYEKVSEIIGDQSDSYIESKFNKEGTPVDHQIAIQALGDDFVRQGSVRRGGFSAYGASMSEKRNIDCTLKFLEHYKAEEKSPEKREIIRTSAQGICGLVKNVNNTDLSEDERNNFKEMIDIHMEQLEEL